MKVLAAIGALAVLVAVAAGVFFFGGFYSVAGTAEEPSFVNWALVHVRSASIVRHAADKPPAAFADPSSVQAGARIYAQIGCVYCHGAPGVNWSKFSEGLHPEPADLKEAADNRTPEQLFWVVRNGINMTGMPSFAGAGATDDDIWKIVAFLKKQPTVSDADFKAWTTKP
jgi:mono/diheme cytochrome c family protein